MNYHHFTIEERCCLREYYAFIPFAYAFPRRESSAVPQPLPCFPCPASDSVYLLLYLLLWNTRTISTPFPA